MLCVSSVEQNFFVMGLFTMTSSVLYGEPRGREKMPTHVDILDVHLAVPKARQLIQDLPSLLILDHAADGIICAREVTFGLEFNVGHEVVLRAPHITVIAKLVLHFAKQDTTRVHVGLSHDTSQ